MIFKLALWCALVAFEEGSEMQLGSALLINTIQLVVHVYLLPLEGSPSTPAWQINSLETGSLVLICFIAFGGFATNYLEVSLQAFPEREAQIKGSIGSLDIAMQVLAFLQFGSMIYLLARDHWKKRKQHVETFRRMRSCVSSTASRMRSRTSSRVVSSSEEKRPEDGNASSSLEMSRMPGRQSSVDVDDPPPPSAAEGPRRMSWTRNPSFGHDPRKITLPGGSGDDGDGDTTVATV